MDEAEKYKQRLEAIAEKRRLQEEQDRVRREMEEEKLRLQQLKRKSLRDQWLMEGPPLSPTSMDAPRSPLWGTKAQDMEKHIDKLQLENQRLAEEQETLAVLTEDGQTDAVKVTEAGAETTAAVVQNGEKHAAVSEITPEGVTVTKRPPLDHTVILTNGEGDLKANTNHKAAEHQSTTNGPIRTAEGVVSTKLEPDQGVSEAEPGQVPNVINEEEDDDEGTLVMRAECVIITDEGDDELASQEDQQPAKTDTGREGGEQEVKTETAPEKSEAAVVGAEGQPGAGAEGTDSSVTAKQDGDGETKAEDPASVQLQSPADALEGATVASVPVYSEAQPCSLNLEPEAVGEASVAPEAAEKTLQDQACPPAQFQEVPLAEPQETQRTEAGPAEQEPLLVKVTSPNTKAEQAGANSPAGTVTQSPARASQGEETQAPKRKTCQCCSVM